MQASRLVDYSDSEDDEEMEWREYHKQRSMLRMPSAGHAPSVTGERDLPSKMEQTTEESTSGRDFAFTPRKRAAFLRSTAGSSPFARSTTSPLGSLSPQVDFSFSPSASVSSPMSDSDTKGAGNPWAAPAVQQVSGTAQDPSDVSRARDVGAQHPAPFTFGAYRSTEASRSASPFTFGAQKPSTSASVKHQAAFPFGSEKSASTNANKGGAFSFTFGSVEKSNGGFAGESHQAASFFTDDDTRRSTSACVEGKTPQRQKDLHRAAKRRESGGWVKSGLSSFGGSPAGKTSSSPASVSPFAFVTSETSTSTFGNGPRWRLHSPMDIEMDENAAAAFTFDSSKSAARTTSTSEPPVFSFSSRVSMSADPRSILRPDLPRTNVHASETEQSVPAFEEKMRTSGRGASSTGTTSRVPWEQSRRFHPPAPISFGKDNKGTSFSFDPRPVQEQNSSDGLSVDGKGASTVPQSRSASFSFEAAFREFEGTAQPWRAENKAGDQKAGSSTSSTRSDATSFFAIGKDKTGGKDSLEVRLARRKQAREAKAALDRQSAPTSTMPVRVQQSPFRPYAEAASQEASVHGYSDRRTTSSTIRGGQAKSSEEKRTTNVFQKPLPASAKNSSKPATSSGWSFKGPSPFNVAEPSMGGVFSFGAATASEPEPNLSPPPVDNLKSNFDGFNLGVAPKAVKSRPAKAKQGRANQDQPKQPSFTSQTFSETNGSFFKTFADRTSESASNLKTSGFVSTPPADPFVTPIFGQKRENHRDAPMPDVEKQPYIPSPFAPNNPSHNHNIPVFGKSNSFTGNVRPPQTSSESKNSDSSGAASTSFQGGAFSIGTPGAAFLPRRRILRAYRPSQPSPFPSKASPDVSNSSEETHRDWSEWKSLGGSAYTKKAYQEAADCYLNSIIVLENLLSDQPELKTDQIMKDKAKLHSNRAAALMMLLQLADAQRECHMSIESDPAYTRAYLRLGRVQVMLGDVDGAKESSITAKQLLSLSGTNGRSDASDSTGIQKIDGAVEKLVKLSVEIKWCLDVHDYSGALSHLQEALAVAPHSRSLQTQKAHALFEQKNYTEVVDYCTGVIRKQKVIERNSEAPQTQNSHTAPTTEDNEVAMLGIELSMLRIRALHCENKVDDAMHHMQKLELAAPCSSKVIQLKRLLLEMKELKHQANELFKKKDYIRAQQVYSQALQLDPANDEYCAVIYCNRAAALMGLEQFENALHDCNAALRRKARYPRCLLRRARCNVALKRYAAAVADFDHYLKEHPTDPSSSAAYGEVDGERQKAIQALENEAHERKRKEEQQKKERQKSNGRSKPQQQQQRRNSTRHAWDDSKFYEDFWRSSSSTAGGSRQQSSGARGSHTNATAHNRNRRTHYDILGVIKTATQDEIKKAYRKLALLHHPDKAKDTVHADLFKDMTAAYNVLSDPSARSTYDREIQSSGYGRYNEY